MMQFINNMFTRKSAIRHLIQLGISVLLLGWSYIALALLTGNWEMFSLDAEQFVGLQALINAIGVMFILSFCAVFGILTYWNAKKWMLPCLKRSGLYLLGAIPFVNLLVPDEMMNSWWDEITDLTASDGTVTTYYDEFGKLYSTRDNGMWIVFAIPIGILKALIKGVGKGALNLIAAIGIPVLSPMSVVLGAIATQLLMDWNNTAALIIAIVCMLTVLFVLVAQPIIAFVKGKN